MDGGWGGVIAAVLEPEDADGEDGVDGGLGLRGVDGDDGPGVLAANEGTSGVGGAEGALEVHGGAEGLGTVVGEGAKEDAIEDAEVALAGGLACGGGAEVLVGGELEGLRAGLAEALGGETEGAGAGGDGEDTADEVAMLGPEVEGGAVVFGGDGEPGLAEVEKGAAVFEEQSVGVFGEKGLDDGADVSRGLGFRCCGYCGTCCAIRHGVTVTAASGCGDSTSA